MTLEIGLRVSFSCSSHCTLAFYKYLRTFWVKASRHLLIQQVAVHKNSTFSGSLGKTRGCTCTGFWLRLAIEFSDTHGLHRFFSFWKLSQTAWSPCSCFYSRTKTKFYGINIKYTDTVSCTVLHIIFYRSDTN